MIMNMINLKTLSYAILFIAIVTCKSEQIDETNDNAIGKSDLRYVAFGTSVTYGSGVKHPDRETYIKLLSKNGINLGIRASDPSYPSICTQSMLGDAIYDVIIIEYDRRYEMGLNALVKRLRERFIDATIVVTNVWTFMNVDVVDEDNTKMPFRIWLANNGFNENTPEARDFVANSNVKFSFDTDRLLKRQIYMNELVENYNVKIFSWRQESANIKGLLLRFLPLYTSDFVHWSRAGHRFAAINISKLVKEEKTQVSNRVGSWGEGDVCEKWLGGGRIKSNALTNGQMVQFDSRWGGKFALEFTSKGYINIENPFDGPRELAITFMTTGPSPSIYPKTKLSIENSKQEEILVDPLDTFYDYPVHVQRTLVIGNVNPGRNNVLITPIEVTEKPFRLVGYSITNESRKISSMWMKSFPTE